MFDCYTHAHIGNSTRATMERESTIAPAVPTRKVGTASINSERLNVLAVLGMDENLVNCHPEIKKKIIDLFTQIRTRIISFLNE